MCHVAFARDGQPFAIPTAYARLGDTLYLHGSAANRVFGALRDGAETCVNVTLLDGLVLARSAFHASMNFRSVVIYGRCREVTDPVEKLEALRALVEHVLPERWDTVRGPNAAELKRTLVLALPLDEASAKLRSGGPVEEQEDYALEVWAGVIPLRTAPDAPLPDDRVAPDLDPPPAAARYHRPGWSRPEEEV